MSWKPHVNLTKMESGGSASFETEKIISMKKQAKFSPLPFRILDEECWLSGSELKTDNSSSEDDEVGRSFVGAVIQGATKTKLRSKKRINSMRNVMTYSTLSCTKQTTSTKSYEGLHTLRRVGQENLLEDHLVTATSSMWSSSTLADGKTVQIDVKECSEKQWRPKRGSFSLQGLLEQVETKQ